MLYSLVNIYYTVIKYLQRKIAKETAFLLCHFLVFYSCQSQQTAQICSAYICLLPANLWSTRTILEILNYEQMFF